MKNTTQVAKSTRFYKLYRNVYFGVQQAKIVSKVTTIHTKEVAVLGYFLFALLHFLPFSRSCYPIRFIKSCKNTRTLTVDIAACGTGISLFLQSKLDIICKARYTFFVREVQIWKQY